MELASESARPPRKTAPKPLWHRFGDPAARSCPPPGAVRAGPPRLTRRPGRLALPLVLAIAIAAAAPATAAPVRDGAHYVEGVVVVRFAATATKEDRNRLYEDLGATEIRELPWKDFALATITRRSTVDAIARWEKSPTVASIEPNGIVYAVGSVPDDPEFLKQWHLRNQGQTTSAGEGKPGADIGATRAWCISKGDPSVVVAVLDTGIAFDHPDLAGSIFSNPGEIANNGLDDDHNGKVDDVRGWDYEDHLVTGGDNDPVDTSGHGTLVAGVIGAAEDGAGAVGVAPGVTLLPIRVLTNTNTSPPSGTHVQAALGIRYAVEMGARVINCSFGSVQPSGLVEAAILDAQANQIHVVCGAGNDARDNDQRSFYPASFPHDNVISVTATTPQDEFAANFANYGHDSVDLAAPGVAIWGAIFRSGNPYDLYGGGSGTSFATPMVTGALALLESFTPGLEHPTPREVLLSAVDRLPSLSGQVVSDGRLNVHRMLASVVEPDIVPPATIDDLEVVAAGTHWVELEWTAPGDDGSVGIACCYDIRWSPSPIEDLFEDAVPVDGPAPAPGLSRQRLRVEGLAAQTPYWFAIRTRDEVFGISASSNEPTVVTLPAGIAVTPLRADLLGVTGQTGVFVLQIQNPSAVPLDFSLATEAAWIFTTTTSGTVPPGEVRGTQIRWDAAGLPGTTYQGAVVITSTAVGAALIRVPVELVVSPAPDIDVGPTSLDLGAPFVGHGAEGSITVRNLGFRELRVEDILSDREGLSASPASFSLGPGSIRDVTVTLVPQTTGPVPGTLTLLSNSPLEFSTPVSVAGVGVAPPVLDVSVNAVAAVGITGTETDPVPIIVRNMQTEGPDLELSFSVQETTGRSGAVAELLPIGELASARAEPTWLTLPPGAVTVQPGGQVTVTLQFSTAEVDPGLFSARITMESNDPDRPETQLPVTFDVSGVAGMMFDARSGKFAATPAGTFAEKVLPISNAGNDTLIVQPHLSGSFTAGPAEVRVGPGETGELRVRYRPSGRTRDAAMLRLFANDPARPITVLPLTGRGVETTEWSGTVHLDRPVVVPEGSELTIAAGTRVEAHAPLGFARGAAPAALEIRGRVVIAGTEAAPVEIGTNANATWAGVIVSGSQGRAELRHVTVSGAAVGLRVTGGAEADVACSRIVGNAIGVDYDGGGLTAAWLSGTRLENHTVNLRVWDSAGLAASGPGAGEPGRNVFALGDDPSGAWNVDATDATASIRLDGNAWFDADGSLLGTPGFGVIQATIRRVSGAQTFVMPVLEQPPLPCDEVPLSPISPQAPSEFSFARAIPNPIRGPISLDYALPGGFLGLVVVDVFDVRGARVRRIVERFTFPGRHVAQWNLDSDRGGQVSSGVYFLRFEAAGYSSTRKVLVLR